MNVYKQLSSKDIITTPFVVNKTFTFAGIGSWTSSSIDILVGKDYKLSEEGSEDQVYSYKTGFLTSSYYINNVKPSSKTIYASARQLYYGNYTSSSIASGSFVNSFANTISSSYYFPTQSSNGESPAQIATISIPRNLYGNHIQPNSFFYINPGNIILEDDGEGNIMDITTGTPSIIGNIFYEQGIIVITKNPNHPSLTDDGFYFQFEDHFTIKNTQISFKSTEYIYESQIKCSIRADEFNYSLNPSLLKNSGSNILGYFSTESKDVKVNEDYKSFVTGSDFTPYVSTIGLYNEKQELMAVAKLAQPLPTSQITDTTILINIDR